MKKIFAIITLAVISLVGLAQNNTVVWANGELIQDAVADSLFLYESEWADTVHLLIPKIVVREVHKTVYIHDTVYVECPETPENPDVQGETHEYVDLGLPSGLKWATCNVGANAPEEYGDYFAWGEVEPKEYYEWSTYKYCKGSVSSIIKYCISETCGYRGFTDGKKVLDLEDDAAMVNWGGEWRTPTKAEQKELRDNCTWEWVTENGVCGYRVTSNIIGYSDRSIFLPAGGYMFEGGVCNEGSLALYMSSSLNDYSESNLNYYIYFYSEGVFCGSTGVRLYGQLVRPVCP